MTFTEISAALIMEIKKRVEETYLRTDNLLDRILKNGNDPTYYFGSKDHNERIRIHKVLRTTQIREKFFFIAADNHTRTCQLCIVTRKP